MRLPDGFAPQMIGPVEVDDEAQPDAVRSVTGQVVGCGEGGDGDHARDLLCPGALGE